MKNILSWAFLVLGWLARFALVGLYTTIAEETGTALHLFILVAMALVWSIEAAYHQRKGRS